MDVNTTLTAIESSGIRNDYATARNALNKVWDQNRKSLFSMVLDDNVPEGVDAVEELPDLIDDAIAEMLAFREKAISLSYDIG